MENSKLPYHLMRRIKSDEHDQFFGATDQELEGDKGTLNFVDKIVSNSKSGLILALVNFPMCISLAVASGSTPTIGILSGIIGGLVSGLFGGSEYNVIGPTGALSGFLVIFISNHGPDSLPVLAVCVGVITLIAKFLSMEKYIDLFPSSVNEGFTIGVALIIFFGQMNNALGIGIIRDRTFVRTEELNQFGEVMKITDTVGENTLLSNIILNFEHIEQMKLTALIIFTIVFCNLLFLSLKFPKFPWMVISAIAGIIIGTQGFAIDTLGSKYGEFSLGLNLNFYHQGFFSNFIKLKIWVDSLPVVFVAILETLISAKIADGMTNTRFKKKKELRGLALSNLVSGFLGGIPVTAALARTALNINSGANSKFSSAINGFLLIIIGKIFISFVKYIPLCVVAAQVCVVAVKMVNIHEIKKITKSEKNNTFILIAIPSICIISDPTTGIIFGMLIYLIGFCQHLTKPWTEVIATHEKIADLLYTGSNPMKNNNEVLVDNVSAHLSDVPKQEGMINFMNANEHISKLKSLLHKSENVIVISLRYMHFIDIEALHALKLILEKVEKKILKSNEINSGTYVHKNKKIIISGVTKSKLVKIQDEEWIQKLEQDGCILYNEH